MTAYQVQIRAAAARRTPRIHPGPISASQLSLKQKTLQKRLTQIEYH